MVQNTPNTTGMATALPEAAYICDIRSYLLQQNRMGASHIDLAQPTSLRVRKDVYVFAAGRLTLHPNGLPKQGQLALDMQQVIGGARFRQRAFEDLELYDNNIPTRGTVEEEGLGFTLTGEGLGSTVLMPKGSLVGFDADGSVAAGMVCGVRLLLKANRLDVPALASVPLESACLMADQAYATRGLSRYRDFKAGCLTIVQGKQVASIAIDQQPQQRTQMAERKLGSTAQTPTWLSFERALEHPLGIGKLTGTLKTRLGHLKEEQPVQISLADGVLTIRPIEPS